MNLTEKTLTQDYHYKGRIINMRVDGVELPGGHTSIREVVEHPGGVTVAALTEKNEMLFVRQYRYPYAEVVLEAPAGMANLDHVVEIMSQPAPWAAGLPLDAAGWVENYFNKD